jgi:CDP-6-deoxy-D-xylo-4-hexulose-3-dehydrase
MSYPITHNSWDLKEVYSLKKIIKGNLFTMGSKVIQFENKFKNFLGSKHSIMVNSGSSANLLAINGLFYKKKNPLKAGDEVIVPALGWSTTYSPLQQLGLKLIIVDIDKETLNINFELLKKAITKKTKLIVVVNLLGLPCDLLDISKICKDNKIYLFEDNCEALGSDINGKKTGTFGDLSSHSLYYSHHINTIEGGVICTNNFELDQIIRSLRAHGWTRDIQKKKLAANFFKSYEFIYPGYNLRPTEINAAIGIEQLKKLNKFIKIRKKNFNYFYDRFKNNKTFFFQKKKYNSSNFAIALIIKESQIRIRSKIFKLLDKNKIDYRLIVGGCFTEQKYSRYFNYKIFNNLNNAKYVHKNGFYIGNYGKNLNFQIERLYKIFKRNNIL